MLIASKNNKMKAVFGSLLHTPPSSPLPIMKADAFSNESKYISFPVFSVTDLGYLSAAVGGSSSLFSLIFSYECFHCHIKHFDFAQVPLGAV